MIQMYHVNKSYSKDTQALKDINLRINKGEFVFITGPSGAGKTTLLKLIFREETPNEGQILVAGRNIVKLRNNQVAYLRREIGVVFQDFKLITSKTVYENIALVLHVIRVPKKKHKSIVYRTLKRVGLEHKINDYPLKLSGGEQQRIAIARALVNNPHILLADEPTGNLDPDRSLDIMELFKDINIKGTTVVIATHDREMIKRLQKKVITLYNGRLEH